MDRRAFLGAGAGIMFAELGSTARAGDAADLAVKERGEFLRLWPSTPPGGRGVHLTMKVEDFTRYSHIEPDRVAGQIGSPSLQVIRPDNPNGAAMLILPGGGYTGLWFDKEGYEIARHFAQSGITGFVLFYRLPGEGWSDRADVPLQDAQRAMRLIRANASKFAIDPERLGVMGFSAGGHLAALLATKFDSEVYPIQDDADKIAARPAFAALLYPVITMGQGTHQGSRDSLLGPDPSPQEIAAYSCENLATAKTPPTFIAQAVDDNVVPFAPNGLAMFQALLRAGTASELHAFEHGGHGFAIRDGAPGLLWSDLFLAWLGGHNVLRSSGS